MLSLLETLSLTFPHRQSVDDMASPQRNDDPNPEDTHDPSAEVTTCSNADVFRRINNLLSNALNFTNVCDTPPHYRTPEQPHDVAVVDNRRSRFTSSDDMSSDDMSSSDVSSSDVSSSDMSGALEMPMFMDDQDVASWDQPWSSQEISMADTWTPSSSSPFNDLSGAALIQASPDAWTPYPLYTTELTPGLPHAAFTYPAAAAAAAALRAQASGNHNLFQLK